MLHLLDARTKQSKLSGLLAEQMKLPALTGKSCSFYAITCYFGFDAAKKLAAELYRAAKQAKVNLTGFHILYEAREWAKQRTDEQTATIEAIKKLLRIPSDDRCTLTPVSATHNDLMHSKVYALIDESKRAGIVVTTSGNLTAPGLGINSKDRNNMEIAKVSGGAQDVSAFQDVFSRLSSMGIDEASVLKHDDFLFAVRLLSLGVFYHQWQGSLASEVRFSLKLSEYGKQRAREGNEAFRSRGYEVERNTVSKDPLGLERIFIKVPKPLPAEFTRMFCVDTLLGRWFPERVAGVMDCKLAQDVEPYMEKLQAITEPKKLQNVGIKLEDEIRDIADMLDHVDQPSVPVEAWKEKARRLRDNSELVQRLVFRFQRLEVPLSVLERSLIRATYDSLRASVKSKPARGELKRALETAIDERQVQDCMTTFRDLHLKAAYRLFPEWSETNVTENA